MTNLEEDIFGEWLFNCYGKHDKILTWCSQKVPLRGPSERPLDTQNRSFRTFVYTTLNCKLCQFWDFITRLHENFASILGRDESKIQCKVKKFFVSLPVSNSVFFSTELCRCLLAFACLAFLVIFITLKVLLQYIFFQVHALLC